MTGQGSKPGFAWRELWPLMTIRASMAAMFMIFLLADLGAGWLHMVALTGFGYAAGSAIAAGRTRQRDLLLVATSPPAIFLAAVTAGELITLHLDHVAASPGLVLADIFLTLSTAAPWLFGGLAGALLIATVRGLPQCVRDLRAQLAGRFISADPPPARPGGWPSDGIRRVRRPMLELPIILDALSARHAALATRRPQLPGQGEGHALPHGLDLFDRREASLGQPFKHLGHKFLRNGRAAGHPDRGG